MFEINSGPREITFFLWNVRNNDSLCGMFEHLQTATDTTDSVKVIFSLIMFV